MKNKNILVTVDNSEKSPGFKFAEAEVNGIPVRIEIGERDLAENKITFARRDTREKMTETLDVNVVEYTKKLLDIIQENLYNNALKRREELTYKTDDLEEIKDIMNTKPGFIYAHWCGEEECELKMKEIRGTKSRCIVEEEVKSTDKCAICGKPAKHMVYWGRAY